MAEATKKKRRRRKRRRARDEPVDGGAVAVRRTAPPGADLNAQRRIAAGATLVIVGLGFVGIDRSWVGMILVLGGLSWLLWSIHKYGRLGPE